MYRKIVYGDTSHSARLEYPWRGNPTSVSFAVYNTAGTALQASSTASVRASTTLASAVYSGGSTVVVATGATWAAGDVFALTGGRSEECEVESYASSTKTITLARPLGFDHASGTAVVPRFCTGVIDASDTDVFYKNLELNIVWTPSGIDDPPFSERAQIVAMSFDTPSLYRYFAALYPVESMHAAEVLDQLEDLATARLAADVSARGRELAKLREPTALREPMIHLMGWFSALRGGDLRADNAERAYLAYKLALESLSTSDPLWFDDDQDNVKNDAEIDSLMWLPAGAGRVGGF